MGMKFEEKNFSVLLLKTIPSQNTAELFNNNNNCSPITIQPPANEPEPATLC